MCKHLPGFASISMYSTVIVRKNSESSEKIVNLLKKIVLWHVHQVTQLENDNVSQRIKDLKVVDKSFKTKLCILEGQKIKGRTGWFVVVFFCLFSLCNPLTNQGFIFIFNNLINFYICKVFIIFHICGNHIFFVCVQWEHCYLSKKSAQVQSE